MMIRIIVVLASYFSINLFASGASQTKFTSIYGGLGSQNYAPHYLYFNAGLQHALAGTKGKLKIGVDYFYGQKKFNYSYYSLNDYAYKYKRESLGPSLSYTFFAKYQLNFSVGSQLLFTGAKGNLITENDRIMEVILDKMQHSAVTFGWEFKLNYQFKNKSGLYAKLNFHTSNNEVTHPAIFFVGYNYILNKIEKQQ